MEAFFYGQLAYRPRLLRGENQLMEAAGGPAARADAGENMPPVQQRPLLAFSCEPAPPARSHTPRVDCPTRQTPRNFRLSA